MPDPIVEKIHRDYARKMAEEQEQEILADAETHAEPFSGLTNQFARHARRVLRENSLRRVAREMQVLKWSGVTEKREQHF